MKIRLMGIFLLLISITSSALAFEDQDKPPLTVSIRSLTGQIHVGDPIEIEFIITNIGASNYTYRDFDQGGRSNNYRLKAKGESGTFLKDPRVIWRGGLTSQNKGEEKTLVPEASVTRTELLNRWALIKQAGQYEVTGSYFTGAMISSISGTEYIHIDSQPITITVLPRSDEAMEAYIEKLGQNLRTTKDSNVKDGIIQRLAFTADARMIPHLIHDMYQLAPSEWTQEALNYYISDEEALKKALMESAAEKGLRGYGLVFLKQLGCSLQELKPLVLKSLQVDHPESLALGAVYAIDSPDDELTALLAKAVQEKPIKDRNARMAVISALMAHRTDDSLTALKTLLKDTDPELRELTKQFIAASLQNPRSDAGGKPFTKDDFQELDEGQDEFLFGEVDYGEYKTDLPLTLSIHPLKDQIKLGDQIPIEFHITNHGKSEYSFLDRSYDRSGRMHEFVLVAKDSNGRVLRDPRIYHQGGIGGGLSKLGKLASGESFKKIIDLNRWALIRKLGEYEVNGFYAVEGQSNAQEKPGYILSQPIKIHILPRTDQETAELIKSLGEQLQIVQDAEKRDEIIEQLMYTGDSRIIPYLIDDMYQLKPSYWTWEAFECYLADEALVKETLFKAAKEKGLVGQMANVLKRLGVTSEEMIPLISHALKSDNPNVLAQACALVLEYWDDSFTAPLVEIANSKEDDITNLILTRTYAINALASNRSDESVGALKNLLKHPDPAVRMNVKRAIQTAYHFRGRWKGKPLYREDFPGIYEFGESYEEDTRDLTENDKAR